MDTNERERHEIAMARFAAVAPVINNTFTEVSAAAYYRRIAEEPFQTLGGTLRHYSPLTFEDWVRKYRRSGIEGLMPKSRSDAGHARKLTEDAKSALYVLKNRFPKMNATMMYEQIIADGVIDAHEISLSTVQRFAKRAFGQEYMPLQDRERRAFSSERVNGIWQADTLYGPYKANPKERIFIQTIIDDKSRCIVASRAVLADNATSFQSTLKHAVSAYGIPEKLYVDNGSAYRNDQLNIICGQLGVVLVHAPVRDGAAKGKIERANRTLRTRFLSVLEAKDTASLETFQDLLSAWVMRYNTTSHSTTGRRPVDIVSAEAHLLRKPISEAWLKECFLNKITRKVSRDGCVRILKRDFDCPCSYINMSVDLRYDPTDLSKVTIYDGERRIECFPTDREANAKTKRQKPAFDIDYSKAEREGGMSDVEPLL